MGQVLVVLTGRSEATIREEGGSGDWLVNPVKVYDVEYVVCVRHGRSPYDHGPGARPEQHGEAFLVGKVANLVVTYRKKGRDRYRILFSSVAKVSGVPDFWDGSRVPTRYMDTVEAEKRGVGFAALKFEDLPIDWGDEDQEDERDGSDAAPPADTFPAEQAAPAHEVVPLTILAAKNGLAATFGVAPENIEIIIRG